NLWASVEAFVGGCADALFSGRAGATTHSMAGARRRGLAGCGRGLYGNGHGRGPIDGDSGPGLCEERASAAVTRVPGVERAFALEGKAGAAHAGLDESAAKPSQGTARPGPARRRSVASRMAVFLRGE